LQEDKIGHIEAARWANCIVVVPATANFLGKMANGIADDLISTIVLAALCPVIIAPSMNWAMWQNEIVQENVKKLLSRKFIKMVLPDSGDLACGETGQGRLADLNEIMDAVHYASYAEQDLSGEMVLVTAGPTYEDIDPVRFVANRSSGKMGFAIAREARARGAKVVLIAGPNRLTQPTGMDIVNVRSAEQMLDAVMQHAPHANIIVKAAAVADYRPARFTTQKIHKSPRDVQLAMQSTVDILKTLGKRKGRNQFLVGFAAETQQVLESGRNKLRSKQLDLIVVNDISQEGAGFDVDTNVVRIIDKKGHVDSLPKMDKSEIAHVIFDIVQKQRASKKPARPRKSTRKTTSRAKSTASKRTTTTKPAEKIKNDVKKAEPQKQSGQATAPKATASNKQDTTQKRTTKPTTRKTTPKKPATSRGGKVSARKLNTVKNDNPTDTVSATAKTENESAPKTKVSPKEVTPSPDQAAKTEGEITK